MATVDTSKEYIERNLVPPNSTVMKQGHLLQMNCIQVTIPFHKGVFYGYELLDACAQADEGTLDYRGFNITKEIMLDLAEEVTGKRSLPGFSQTVIYDEEITCYLRLLHEPVMSGSPEFDKEENLLLLLSLLIQRYGQPFEECIPECREEIERACTFMEQHYTERIYLDRICRCANLSKSTLLRAFVKSKGVTPYRYLENVRIGAAKKLLEQGVAPIDAAMQTGFSDQSHFTN